VAFERIQREQLAKSQQTQKSFSTIHTGTLRRAAVH